MPIDSERFSVRRSKILVENNKDSMDLTRIRTSRERPVGPLAGGCRIYGALSNSRGLIKLHCLAGPRSRRSPARLRYGPDCRVRHESLAARSLAGRPNGAGPISPGRLGRTGTTSLEISSDGPARHSAQA